MYKVSIYFKEFFSQFLYPTYKKNNIRFLNLKITVYEWPLRLISVSHGKQKLKLNQEQYV